jgi:TolA-binding protein
MLTLLTIVSIIVLSIILLILLFSSMRIKIYKDRWETIQSVSQSKASRIHYLEQELQKLQMKNASDTQKLLSLIHAKETLKEKEKTFDIFKKECHALTDKIKQITNELQEEQAENNNLKEIHQALITRFDSSIEENMKHRSNNARLLSKIEAKEVKRR